MKFATRQDAALPAERLFAAVADFDRLQRLVLRDRAQVEALPPEPGALARWRLVFAMQGKTRDAVLRLTERTADSQTFEGHCDGLDLTLAMRVEPLAPDRSRLAVQMELRPRSLRARLTLQAAWLGKAILDEKFVRRVAGLVAAIELA